MTHTKMSLFHDIYRKKIYGANRQTFIRDYQIHNE
jgi:hypothetical protein